MGEWGGGGSREVITLGSVVSGGRFRGSCGCGSDEVLPERDKAYKA